MVGVLELSTEDRGFAPQSGQNKDSKIGMCSSLISTHHYGKRPKTSRIGIRMMCPSGATCLSADCCFNELALLNPTKCVGLVPSKPHHHLIEK